eukprot:1157003-Pelagomonas_calceolata.AAC.9
MGAPPQPGSKCCCCCGCCCWSCCCRGGGCLPSPPLRIALIACRASSAFAPPASSLPPSPVPLQRSAPDTISLMRLSAASASCRPLRHACKAATLCGGWERATVV